MTNQVLRELVAAIDAQDALRLAHPAIRAMLDAEHAVAVGVRLDAAWKAARAAVALNERLKAWQKRAANLSKPADEWPGFVTADEVAAESAEALVAEPPSLFAQMEKGYHAEIRAEQALEEILGVELLGISFDDYDGSFEIFADSEVSDIAPTSEQDAAIKALGCTRYWINFPDGTERHCTGIRKPAAGSNRWEDFDRRALAKRTPQPAPAALPVALSDEQIERIAGKDELTGYAILEFARNLIAALSHPVGAGGEALLKSIREAMVESMRFDGLSVGTDWRKMIAAIDASLGAS